LKGVAPLGSPGKLRGTNSAPDRLRGMGDGGAERGASYHGAKRQGQRGMTEAGARILTLGELAATWGQLRGPRDRALFGLCFFAALRVGEAVALDLADVVDGGQLRDGLRVRRTVGRGEVLRDRTKNGERRDVPIGADLAAVLATLVDTFRPDLPPGPLFRSRSGGGRLTTRSAARALGRAFLAAGVHRASPHSLRKTWTVEASRNGVHVRLLRSILGHKSLRSTQHYLVEVAEYEKRAAVETVRFPMEPDNGG